jgi:hypothetical protein
MIEFTPHSDKQERALFCTKRILLLGCGTQWGKTQVGGLRMKLKMHTFTAKTDNFLVTAPSYKIMQQSTLPAFLSYMDGYGKYNKAEAIFEMRGGGTCYMRTETDPDSIVGIPNVKHIWGDEAGKYRLYFWENMQARADSTGATIDLTTSPYALNWIYKDLVKPTKQGKRPDIELIQAASWENPYHSLYDPKALAQKRSTMDPRRFQMIYGGEWGQMVGLVYDCWDDERNFVEPFQLPTGTKYYGGVDWGYTDPFVLKVRAVTPDGRHYGISEFYKPGLTLPMQIEIARQKKTTFGIQTFFADPSQPGAIEEFNRNGLPCLPADNDIRKGIDLHYELIKTGKYKEFRGLCPYSADERENYHYPEPKDLKPDQDGKELLPVGQDDHAMDVDRYLTAMTYRRDAKLSPKLPEGRKMGKTRLDRLKYSHRENRGSEKWS